MAGKSTPCHGCKDRHEGCHLDCAAYLSDKATRAAKKEAFDKWAYDTRKDRMDRLVERYTISGGSLN